MNNKGKTFSSLISALLTLSIIALLVISGPAQAISVGFTQEAIDDYKYEYTAVVDIHSPDFVALDLIIVEANTAETNTTCAYDFADQAYNAEFSTGNTDICEYAINITDFLNNATSSSSGGYGYGFGTNGQTNVTGNENVSWSPGYGYEYTAGVGEDDYSATATDGEIRITLILDTNATANDTPIFEPEDTYTVNIGVAGLSPGGDIQYTYKSQSTSEVTVAGVDYEAIFDDIDAALLEQNISSNIETCGVTPTECTGLWFAKEVDGTYIGNLSLSGSIDLTDDTTIALLQSLGENLVMEKGEIGLDASTAEKLRTSEATLTMFGLTYSRTPDIRVFDEEGDEISNDIVDNIDYDADTGILTFNTEHFTTFKTYTSSTHSSSSSSGNDIAGLVTNPSLSFGYQTLAAGTRDITLSSTSIPVYQLSVTTNVVLYDVIFKITQVNNPSIIYTGKAYKYVQIDHAAVPDATIDAVKILFKVEKSWLTSNNLQTSDVQFLRYTNAWTPVAVKMLSEDSTYVYYEAVSPGLSLFVIGAEAPAVEPVVTSEPVQAPAPITGNAVIEEPTATGVTDVKTISNASLAKETSPITRFTIATLSLIALVVALYLVYTRRRNEM